MEVRSKRGALIRLTEERWNHIIDEHGELALQSCRSRARRRDSLTRVAS